MLPECAPGAEAYPEAPNQGTRTQLPQTDAQMSLTATPLSQLTWTER